MKISTPMNQNTNLPPGTSGNDKNFDARSAEREWSECHACGSMFHAEPGDDTCPRCKAKDDV